MALDIGAQPPFAAADDDDSSAVSRRQQHYLLDPDFQSEQAAPHSWQLGACCSYSLAH
jgi:hypothetical protein